MQQYRSSLSLAAVLIALAAAPAVAQPGSGSLPGGPTDPPDILVVPAPPEGAGPSRRPPPPGLALADPAGRFRFRRGDLEVDIHCALQEPMRNCVAAASDLIDKLTGLAPSR